MAHTVRTTLACAAALAVTLAIPATAGAAQTDRTDRTAFAQCATVTGTIAGHIAEQADAQHKAAHKSRATHRAHVAHAAKAAKAKARAKAKAKARARARAAHAAHVTHAAKAHAAHVTHAAKAHAAHAAHAAKVAAAKRKAKAAHASRSQARTALTTGTRSASGWMKPVSSYVSTPYHATSSLWASGYHTGADFVAATGTPVRAIGPATVVQAGWGGSYGNSVILRMSDGMYVLYGHLSSIGVSAGQSVSAGKQLGLSGATGNVTGPHLHFEVRTTQNYGSDVDPVAYLRKHGVTL
ncbi:M23 family metallopeptidase [Streptomyces sp. NBC_01262]|uniref:M23 family metallopeptidase n=1 Tax=Streptomyces sp. NBC_01262 TaxID=2903803 RepID=UPI002E321F1D|nr:M23 family metallopeptidase [Streptomyces sp. NBC_01262]